MQKFLFFFLLLISAFVSAQLDREHWFAPMYDGQSNYESEEFLHLSTNDVNPFEVKVYNNNILFATVTISKGNPEQVYIDREKIITRDEFDLNTVITKGLYVIADRPCFANLRFSVVNHAEIITSKGTAGIGTEFFTVVAPNMQFNNNLGFAASFLATEDNTVVTVNNFKKPLTFTDFGAATEFTFTLNRGQSYIIDGRSTNDDQLNGFIGAKVSATKPISMSNGNFNGQHASKTYTGSDILMDQSVPVERLGNEFIVVKGYGQIGSKMESTIVVATEKNTAVYINDDSTPLTTLANEGDYYLIDDLKYAFRGKDHYNLHIKTDKNIYVYQLLGGVKSGTTALATGGMNYIPPLNCYLPRKIDELSYINKITKYDDDERFVTKLNIITEKNAVIKVNGEVPDAAYGPFDISTLPLAQTWVTYSIPDVKGNLTINSDKAVTAGIASGNGAVGYGGYFAGFSAIPLILKTAGDCIPGVKLEVPEGFDSYEWLIKSGISYIPAPGINNLYFYEPSQAGIYAVKVKQGSCPQIQSKDYKFFNCTTFTNYDYFSCSPLTIIPKFALSTQLIDISTIVISEAPKKGSLQITVDGKIIYTPFPNSEGIDTFKFTYCGINAIPDCEITQITVSISSEKKDAILNQCSPNGIATYNLNLAEVNTDPNVTKVFYETQNGALNQIFAERITNFTNFTTADRLVFVRITNEEGCFSIAKIELRSQLPAILNASLYQKKHCDEDLDGKIDGVYKVELNSITAVILQKSADHITKYFLTKASAIANGNDFISPTFTFTSDTSIWVRVEPKNICPVIIEEVIIATGTKISLNAVAKKLVCDDDLDGILKVDLQTYLSEFTSVPNVVGRFFKNSADALANQNALLNPVSVNQTGTYFIRFSAAHFCDAIGQISLEVIIPKSSPLLENQTICPEAFTTLNAGPGFTAYNWSTGESTPSIENVAVGEYYVDLTSGICTSRQYVSVVAFQLPEIINVEIKGSTLTVNVTGGNPPYQYAIDGNNYQTSAIFTNVQGGEHTIYVISSDNCEPVSAMVNVIELYNAITPNDDGINDVLDYSTLLKKEDAFLQIYDRYGKLVFAGDKNNRFSWDGKTSGKLVTTGTFWYVMKWKEPGFTNMTEYSGWLLVKNRN